MRIASVILDIATQALDTAYSYVLPEDLVEAEVGCAVLVPFGYRQAIAYIIEIDVVDEEDSVRFKEMGIDASKLKAVQEVLSCSYFDEDGAACARFMAERYIAPLSACIRLFTPPGGVPRMVRSNKQWRIEEPQVGAVDDRWVNLNETCEFVPKPHAVKQKAILEALESGDLKVVELAVEFGAISSTLKTLEGKGAISITRRRRMRGSESSCSSQFTPSKKPQLTSGQNEVLVCINEAQDRACGEVILVDGVTGSGKTEVYLQAIEKALSEEQGAIVLVPEISLTPQTVARFRGRFGDTIAVMHSRMSQGERYDQWDRIKVGDARVVVGARSALFTPIKNLGLIVIDEEHEGSYKQDSAPRYVSRDVAEWMVHKRHATLVLGSATPSIEALYKAAKKENWHHAVLPDRVNGKEMPAIEVVDMAKVFGSGNRSMFSPKLVAALCDCIEAGQKAVLLLNQRGFARFLLCRNCGFVPECPSCALSLTYHERGNTLVCHHCGHKEQSPASCPQCGSPYLQKFGAGTQRVEAELVARLSDYETKIIRMDADTTSRKGSHQRLLEEFGEPGPAVLLGTQMIAKGLDYDDVTLVGVINADTILKLPDFRSAERTFDLIEQVAGRAGRAHLPGKVIVQTYLADAAAIRAAAAYDRAQFLRSELPKRKELGYPPYKRLANVLVWGKNEYEVKSHAQEIFTHIDRFISEQGGSDWIAYPAVPCVLAKLRDTFRYHIVVRAPESANISQMLTPIFRKRKTQPNVNVAVDVDPDDLL
ncbi:MAG: replication restart helicase PriA [Raoultibacter sp.]|jgi:primosomal protein N' (replication factor Y)